MPFELQDFQDLVRSLREHPDWREELRALLLTQELLTLPALAARQWTDRVGRMTVLAAALGALSGVLGLCLSAAFDIAAGGTIALTATAVFVFSAAVRRAFAPR